MQVSKTYPPPQSFAILRALSFSCIRTVTNVPVYAARRRTIPPVTIYDSEHTPDLRMAFLGGWKDYD